MDKYEEGEDLMEEELSDVDYLRNLADRLFKVPAVYGVDQYDYERLLEIAFCLEEKK